jgi:RND family efflux transporter MFP subunit
MNVQAGFLAERWGSLIIIGSFVFLAVFILILRGGVAGWRKHSGTRTPRRALIPVPAATIVLAILGGCFAGESFAAQWWENLEKDIFGGQAPAKKPQPKAVKPVAPVVPAAAPQEAAPPPQQTPPAPQTTFGPPAAPAIPVVRPKVQTVTEYLDVTGNAASVNTVKLIARVVGYLEQLHFADGQLVKQGDLLATIQQDQYKAQLEQAQGQVIMQKAALAHAKVEVVRYTDLLRKDAATQTEVDHWHFQQLSAQGGLQSAEAQVKVAELNLDYTEVRAPFDGIMGRHLIDPGNVVGGNGQEAALVEIMQLDPIYVVANISSQDVLKIRQNLDQRRLSLTDLKKVPIDAALADETGYPHHGKIEYVAPQVDAATGTLFVRGLLPNPDRTLLPGMFVKIRLPMAKVIENALLVPDRALSEDQNGRYLLVLNDDNIVQQRYVQVGPLQGALRVITSGLTVDDRVVIGDLWRAAPGTKVTPRLTPIDAGTSGSEARP